MVRSRWGKGNGIEGLNRLVVANDGKGGKGKRERETSVSKCLCFGVKKSVNE